MADEFDLLGEEYSAPSVGKGRPSHRPTKKMRQKVSNLAALNWPVKRIANAVGLSVPTLREHYFSELAEEREKLRDRIDGDLLEQLFAKAKGGNIAAIDRLRRELDRAEMQRSQQPAKEEPKGKKEKAKEDALLPPEGDEWEFLKQRPN
jgi:hypothetical protein